MATVTRKTGPLGVLLEYSSASPLRPHRKPFDFMDSHWNDNQPIYRQLRDKVVAMILEGTLAEGDALPSVRNVAADHTLNPLTVLKGYQQLVDEGLVEKKRGRGMFVTAGARGKLMKDERARFLEHEWPRVLTTIERLGLDAGDLLKKSRTA